MTTEAKHTPGPWTAVKGDHGESWGGYWQIDAEFDAVACNQFCHAGARDQAVSEANAHLIAAAPNLLSALERLDADWTKTFPDGPEGSLDYYGIGKMADETVSIWRDIRAALAKARGQS